MLVFRVLYLANTETTQCCFFLNRNHILDQILRKKMTDTATVFTGRYINF